MEYANGASAQRLFVLPVRQAHPEQQSSSSLRWSANPFTTMANISHASAQKPALSQACPNTYILEELFAATSGTQFFNSNNAVYAFPSYG